MRKVVYILSLSFLLSISLFAQKGLEIESVSTPEFVKRGVHFTLSAKVIQDFGQKPIELFLYTDIEISLISAELRSPTLTKQMRFYRVNGTENQFDKVYKIESGDISTSDDNIWQVNCELSTSGGKSLQVYLSSNEEHIENQFEDTQPQTIKVYKESTSVGKCLELSSQTELEFPVLLSDDQPGKVLIEFWAMLSKEQTKILSIQNDAGEEIVNLSVSDFGYLTTSNLLDAEFFNEFFVDCNNWNYFLLELDTKTGELIFYINETLFFDGVVSDAVNKKEMKLKIYNDGSYDNSYLDRLKIWSFQNNLQLALLNKNFNRYSADSSQVIYQNNFDSENSIDQISKSGNLKIVKSTAPIFSQVPSLNVVLYGQSYQLSWEISELSRAQKFEVEKSYNGNDYEPVTSVQVVDNTKQLYGITDIDYTDNQIIYYRVKQINKDDSFIFSSAAKVGRGKIKHFDLEQNYPNPFNPVTTISVEVKRADKFEVLVYDIVGKAIATLHDGPLGEGIHRFNFDGTGLPSGLYLCEIKSGDEIEVMKMILTK